MNFRPFIDKTRSLLVLAAQLTRTASTIAWTQLRRACKAVWSSDLRVRLVRPAKRTGRVVGFAAAMTLAVLAFGAVCFVRVAPATIGVRQVDIGFNRGIETLDYGPGLYFSPRFLSTWHRLDARTNAVSFAWESEGGEHPVLEVRTKEGNEAQVAVVVPYRIRQDEAHMIVESGKRNVYRHRVRATVEKVLLQEFAQLTSADLSDTNARTRRADEALVALNEELLAHNVVAESVLISGVFFPPTYEKKQQEKQLQSQTLRTNQTLAKHKQEKLANDGVIERLLREEENLVAGLDRDFEEQRRLIEDGELVRLRHANELTVMDGDRQVAEAMAVLDATREIAKVAAEKEWSDKRLATDLLSQEIQDEVAELTADLDRSFAEALSAAKQEQAARNLVNERLQLNIAQAEADRGAIHEAEMQTERIAHELELQELRHHATTYARTRKEQADNTYETLVADGKLALVQADVLRDRLRGEALETEGGRVYLAREAASNLRLDHVTLDSGDPGVPSILDLDRMIELLVGGGPKIAKED